MIQKQLHKEEENLEAIPVVLLPDCDLTGVETLSLFGPFDTWREQVEQLSPEVRGQIRRLFLDGSHGYLRTSTVNRTLSRTQYLNRGNDEPAIDLSVLELFPSLGELSFNQVQNFDVNRFANLQWPNIRIFRFCAMRIGRNTDWLRRLHAPALEELDLSFNVVGLPQIEAVLPDLDRNCPRLRSIDIRNAAEAYREGDYQKERRPGLALNFAYGNYLYGEENPEVLEGLAFRTWLLAYLDRNEPEVREIEDPEIDWINDFPYYNYPGTPVDKEKIKKINEHCGITVNTKDLHVNEQESDDSENESENEDTSRVSSNRSDSSENESESRNGVSHRSSSDSDQESGSEN